MGQLVIVGLMQSPSLLGLDNYAPLISYLRCNHFKNACMGNYIYLLHALLH